MKVVGIPGEKKLWEKWGFLNGLMQKGGKFHEGHEKLTGNPGGSTSKKMISSTGGGTKSPMII